MAITLSEASWNELWVDWHYTYRTDATDECDWLIEYPPQRKSISETLTCVIGN